MGEAINLKTVLAEHEAGVISVSPEVGRVLIIHLAREAV